MATGTGGMPNRNPCSKQDVTEKKGTKVKKNLESERKKRKHPASGSVPSLALVKPNAKKREEKGAGSKKIRPTKASGNSQFIHFHPAAARRTGGAHPGPVEPRG